MERIDSTKRQLEIDTTNHQLEMPRQCPAGPVSLPRLQSLCCDFGEGCRGGLAIYASYYWINAIAKLSADRIAFRTSIRETHFWVNAGGDEAFSTPDSIL